MILRKNLEEDTHPFLRELENDPEYIAMRARKDAEHQAAVERGRIEEALLLADLRRVGYRLESVWDFVNTAESYPEALPVLLDHLRRPYSDIHREGIARALTVKEARGTAGPAMVTMLRDPSVTGPQLRWALANALTIVATRAEKEDIKTLLVAEPAGDVQDRLKRALKTAAKA